jgi:hypothetical protein
MHRTIRAFVFGSIVVASLGCNSHSDAAEQATPAVQSAPLTQQPPAKPAEPAQPAPPIAAEPAHAAAPTAPSDALCLAACRKASGLHCTGAEDCTSGCRELLALRGCLPVVTSFLECLSKEPLEHWECDSETHVPGIRDGYCEPEQSAIARCMGSAS